MTAKKPLSPEQTRQALDIIHSFLPMTPNYQRNRAESKQVEWYCCAEGHSYRKISDHLWAAGIDHTIDGWIWKHVPDTESLDSAKRSARLRSKIQNMPEYIYSISLHIPHGMSARYTAPAQIVEPMKLAA